MEISKEELMKMNEESYKKEINEGFIIAIESLEKFLYEFKKYFPFLIKE